MFENPVYEQLVLKITSYTGAASALQVIAAIAMLCSVIVVLTVDNETMCSALAYSCVAIGIMCACFSSALGRNISEMNRMRNNMCIAMKYDVYVDGTLTEGEVRLYDCSVETIKDESREIYLISKRGLY